MSEEHIPWARAIFAEEKLWMACCCGWNAMRDGEGTWLEHMASVGDLSAAWAEAEAALPEDGYIWLEGPYSGPPPIMVGYSCHAIVHPAPRVVDGAITGPTRRIADATGPTPAAALRALSARLRAK